MELLIRIARMDRVPPLPVRPHDVDEEDEEDEEEIGAGPSSFQAVPVATYVLLAVLALVFAAMAVMGHSAEINPVVAKIFGDKENDLILEGHQYWRLVTPIFLHGSLIHLAVNSLSLWMLGAQMERLYGWRKYVIIFVLAGIAGNAGSLLRTPEPELGASGALFGLVGAGLIFPVRFRALVPERARTAILKQLLLVAGINLLIGFSIQGVDNWAHLGGLAGGSIVALFFIPDALDYRPPRFWSEIGVNAALMASLGIVGWAAYSQWHWVQIALKTPPPMMEFQPTNDPWWSVGVPPAWRPGQLPLTWLGPNGATLQIIDAPAASPLAKEMVTLVSPGPNRPKSRLTSVDGKPGFLLSLPEQNQQHILDLCLVPTYGHLLLLKMESVASPALHQAAITDFGRIIDSLRIIGSPANNADPTTDQPDLPSDHAPPNTTR